MDRIDGNLHALNIHLAEQDMNDKAFDEMQEDIAIAINDDLEQLVKTFDRIVNDYGFDYTFEQWFKDR